jgi:multiple sugar transport system substrate-binding protein
MIVCALLLTLIMGVFGVQAQDYTEVRMVYWTGPESLAMAQVVDAYNAGQGVEDGVRVQLVLFGREGFWERQEALIAAESSDVDIYYTASYYVGRQVGALAPITDAVPDILETGVLFERSINALSADGVLYGLPLDVSLHFMYYRTDLIEQLLNDAAWQERYSQIAMDVLGLELTPKPPAEWDWNDFTAAALFFSRQYNPDSPVEYGTVLQAKNLVFNTMIWGNVLYSLGGSWFDAEGNPNFDTPEFRQAAQIYADLISLGAAPAASTTFEYGEANQAFMSEQAAFMLQWNAAFGELNGPNSPVSGLVGIAPPAGPTKVTYTHSLGVALNANSERQEAAGAWLRYLATQEAISAYATAGGLPPSAAVLLESDRADYQATAEYLDAYAYTPSTGPVVFGILDILSTNLSAVWARQSDADTAAIESQAEVTELLASSGG